MHMQINGENLLSIEYDRNTHIETIFNYQNEEIINIRYNLAGQPLYFLPSNHFNAVNITYGKHGHIVTWQRGNQYVENEYNDKGLVTSKKLANRGAYRYIYRSGNKVGDHTI